MDVIIVEDDGWWRQRIARALSADGHRVYLYEGEQFTLDALLAWRLALDVRETAVVIDLMLDFDHDHDGHRTSLDVIGRWMGSARLCRPLLFISGSQPPPSDLRKIAELGGIFVGSKQDIEDWGELLRP